MTQMTWAKLIEPPAIATLNAFTTDVKGKYGLMIWKNFGVVSIGYVAPADAS